MSATFTAWEECWFAAGEDDETRARRSAKDWALLIGVLAPNKPTRAPAPEIQREEDDWDAAIRRAKALAEGSVVVARPTPPPPAAAGTGPPPIPLEALAASIKAHLRRTGR